MDYRPIVQRAQAFRQRRIGQAPLDANGQVSLGQQARVVGDPETENCPITAPSADSVYPIPLGNYNAITFRVDELNLSLRNSVNFDAA